MSNNIKKYFQIFVAFSEYMNFMKKRHIFDQQSKLCFSLDVKSRDECRLDNCPVHLDLENDLILSLQFFSKMQKKNASGGLIMSLEKFGLI